MASDEEKAIDEGLWDVVTNLQNDYGFDNLVFNAVIETLRDTYTQGRADAWRWIPVSERLPEFDKLILVCNPRSIPTTYGKYLITGKWAINDEPDYSLVKVDIISFVTHWMPLPESIKLPGGEND
jgi:hypothetical protein